MDWATYWDSVPYHEYKAVKALRRIEHVGHEREDWRAAVVALTVQSAFSKIEDPQEALESLLALMQDRKPDQQIITGSEAARIAQGKHGNVR